MKPRKACSLIGFGLAVTLIFAPLVRGEGGETTAPSPPEKPSSLTLVRAFLCEGIKDTEPQNETVVFSITLGQVVCFTAFDPVPEKTEIHHNWFRKDRPDAQFKLTLKPPRWATYSKINLESADAGPWRVEITDSGGNILKILRFSVTE